MTQEIELKYLVNTMPSLECIEGERIAQGYLSESLPIVRVRIRGSKGYLTIKGASEGISRAEFEYEIPLQDAEILLQEHAHFGHVDKTRYCIPHDGHVLELDVFHGANAGLAIVEVELESEHSQVSMPGWAGQEVSTDPAYFNSNLAKKG